MLYGLQTTNLNIRRQFLGILRDRVVVRLLANLGPVADKRVRQLLFPVLFALDVQTLDNSSRYWHFKKLMCSIMGVKVRSAGRSFLATPIKAAAVDETAPCQPMRTLRSVPRALNRRSSEAVLSGTVEKRSSVFLPSRQTSWNLMASVQETASATTSPTTMRKRSVHWFDDNGEISDDSEVYV
uniref:CLASP_N domain-containing protein n=1 Tax=Panagrellus redivivus TaxID=6233 RepID=A0A7E4VIE2_PANRE